MRTRSPTVVQGNATAQCNVCRGVPQDFTEAVSWYRKTADHGYVSTQFNVGHLNETQLVPTRRIRRPARIDRR